MSQADWRADMKAACPHARFDEPLAPKTTFKIGGPADCYIEAGNVVELEALLHVAALHGLPLLLLGWGSNVLVADGGVRGVVVRLRGEFERIDFLEDHRVRAGAAVRVPQLVVACAERGLSGDESLVGIPGTVGGALVMNAGTRDGEIGALVREVRILDAQSLKVRQMPVEDLRFSYRSSNLSRRIVLGCVLQLKPGDKGSIMSLVQRYQQKRLQTQPIHTYNVGSTFKNPPGRFAAQLIEEAGLKGFSVGGARVSPMHANFIENFSGAKAAEVLALVRLVQDKVRSAAGVELELEMKVIGEA